MSNVYKLVYEPTGETDMTLYTRDASEWQKVRVAGTTITRMFTTAFERINGYSVRQAKEWGIL